MTAVAPEGWLTIGALIIWITAGTYLSYAAVKTFRFDVTELTQPGSFSSSKLELGFKVALLSVPLLVTLLAVSLYFYFAGPARENDRIIMESTTEQTELDALTAINKGMSDGDKERLSNAFFDFSKVLDQANKLLGEANRAGAQLNQAMKGDSLAIDIELHRGEFREVLASAKEYERVFSESRHKWSHYDINIRYIYGDNPENNAAIIQNAVADYLFLLNLWTTTVNKEGKSLVGLLGPMQKEFNKETRRFSQWRQNCMHRLEEMKQSIE